jgi:hypothetical protein
MKEGQGVHGGGKALPGGVNGDGGHTARGWERPFPAPRHGNRGPAAPVECGRSPQAAPWRRGVQGGGVGRTDVAPWRWSPPARVWRWAPSRWRAMGMGPAARVEAGNQGQPEGSWRRWRQVGR